MWHNRLALLTTLALILAACGGATSSPVGSANPPAPSVGSGGASSEPTSEPTTAGLAPVQLTMWMGYQSPGAEFDSLAAIVREFEALHPGVTVNMEFVPNRDELKKITIAMQGNKQPDIGWQWGTNMPEVAQGPKVVDLTERVKDPAFDWEDFFPGGRAVTVVDGRVVGIPGLVDDLAVVYNKDLFAKANVAEPGPDWTWEDLRAAAKAIAKPSDNIFGLAMPADASELQVWQNIALLWAAGGDLLSPDNKKALFNSPAGVRAVTVLQQIQQDGSLLLDFHPDGPQTAGLFNSGKIGMLITGPWSLPSFPDAKYGVQVMPSFDKGGSHESIAGPDNWVLYDNGPDRVNAAWELVKWITTKENLLKRSLATGHLPLRASVLTMPDFAKLDSNWPGVGKFAENLSNVHKSRPQLTTYPQISTLYGQAIVSVLTGKSTPQEALDAAASQVDGILAAAP